MKRFLSFFMSVVLILLLLPVGRAEAAISADTYSAKVQEFINTPRWANGASWGGSKTQSWEYSDWSSSGCCAYCADFAGYVYGARRAWNDSGFTKTTDPAQIQTGDIVHFNYSNSKRTSQHWIVVLERNGDKLYTAEGNAYVDGKYSVVCITDEKWAIVNGTLKNTWNSTETCYNFEIFHYDITDGSAACTHGNTRMENQAKATCEVEGNTGDTVCADCGEVVEYGLPIPAMGHSWNGDTCTLCGAVLGDVYRLAGSNRFDTAFKVADQMKENLGIARFDSVIVASGTSFADALAGSYLASVKDAPILLSYNDAYNEQVKSYIKSNLNQGGTVYILGGQAAVPASMEEGLTGFNVKRLAGSDRFGTNLAILEEAGVEGKDMLVCTGGDFADSLSASAAGLPILLVWQSLTEEQRAFLEGTGGALYVIGGTGAVSDGLMDEISIYGPTVRLGGSNRFETSVLIAETFFGSPENAVLAYARNYPDGLCGGALASTLDAPLILTMTKYESAAADYIQSRSIGKATILGGTGLISDSAVRTIFALAQDVPITAK